MYEFVSDPLRQSGTSFGNDIWKRIQREGEVVHLVAHQLSDLSAALANVDERALVGNAASTG